jgi:alcohol dehydrogenase class IV
VSRSINQDWSGAVKLIVKPTSQLIILPMLLGALLGGIAALTADSHLCHAMSYPVANCWHTHH